MPGRLQVWRKSMSETSKCQTTVEICFLLSKAIILLLSDRVSVISFTGVGLFFFLNRELVKITYLDFVAFDI